MSFNSYLEFENKFRGDREKIIHLLSSYDSLIEIAIQGNPSPKLLDIGCGRGEWLQRCTDKFDHCLGIEVDLSMIKVCRDNGLNILEGDAINKISELASGSISVVTMFHIIEHLQHDKLWKLIHECQRVLRDDGVLIMETPSIDNLIVSTKSFYLDPTHINPINPDSIAFYLKKIGFSNVKYYYLNGGPLKDANPLKITRILNGVAQDLCIIATKTERKFESLLSNRFKWESSLDIGITTLEAAIDHDLKLESILDEYKEYKESNQNILNQQISKLNQVTQENLQIQQEILFMKEEILLLKARLKYLIYCLNVLKFFLRPIFVLLKSIKRSVEKLILIVSNKIFNTLANHSLTRQFLLSRRLPIIINFMLKILTGNSSNINISQIQSKIQKIIDRDHESNISNHRLILHYKESNRSKEYKQLFSKRK